MRVILCIVAAVAGIAAGTARADGLPVLGIDVGSAGVTVADSPRYVALPAGNETLVARIERGSGKVLASQVVRGQLTIPAVAYDGSASGLARDGAKLVLISPRVSFPRTTTPLAIVDTRTLRVVRRVTLHGDFSFDAVSPDGHWIYLIHYTSPTDPLRYEVRALDAAGTGRLAPKPIVDPREPDEQMGGQPSTRATSTDGRWAYTLYERPGNAPFVHALDTTGRTARCIDLDWLRDPRQLMGPRLVLDQGGQTLRVVSRGVTRAVIDTRTFTAGPPAAQTPTGLLSWLLVCVAAAALLATAAAVFLAAQRWPKWWARGSAVTTSGVSATRRASAERLSSSRTRMFRFRSTRS